MIIVAAVLGLLALFGLPALVGPARAWKARREAAVAARAAEAERQRQRQEHERQETERIWRETPDLAGLGEYLRYQHRMQTPLRHKVEGAEQQYSQRAQDVTARQAALRDGKPVTTPYRVLVFVGLGLFLAVFALAMALDYLIFHGLHPKGTWVLPLGLAALAVVGITVGSVVLLGGTRHRLIPEHITPYGKRVVLMGAGLLVGGIIIAMAVIAPNRSYLGGQEQINTAVRQLSLDQTAQPPVGPDVISADNAAITQAKANLARAEQVDRLSAIVLALIEIPLSEAAILGAELLLFDAAVRRRDSAQQELAAAKQKLEGAQIFFMSELARILVAHGHDEDAVRQMRERYARLMLAWETQRSLPGGAPPGPGAGGAPSGPAPGGQPHGDYSVPRQPQTAVPRSSVRPGTFENPGRPPGGPAQPTTSPAAGHMPETSPVTEGQPTTVGGAPAAPVVPGWPTIPAVAASDAMADDSDLPPSELDAIA